MQTLQLKRTISSDYIKAKMKSATLVSEYKRWQIIYYVSTYMVDAEYLSDTTGYSKSNIYAIVQQFNKSERWMLRYNKEGEGKEN